MTDDEKPNYVDIVNEFGLERVEQRFSYLYIVCERAIRHHKLGELLDKQLIGISPQAITTAVINYFSDISRLKNFHDIEKTNPVKVAAYTTYWFLRERPIYITKDANEEPKLTKLNQAAALWLIWDAIYTSDELIGFNLGRYNQFIEILIYNLRYRLFSPQSLELALEALTTTDLPYPT